LANLDLEKLDLNEAERKAVAEILKEVSENGISTKMNDILLEDYSEIPVSIDTFLHDTRYLGRGLTTGEGKFTLFPY
jgi:MoaA/NifB/PqqE/SkfB family radical SAM enzyme